MVPEQLVRERMRVLEARAFRGRQLHPACSFARAIEPLRRVEGRKAEEKSVTSRGIYLPRGQMGNDYVHCTIKNQGLTAR
jgi:hypothetical protein